MEGLSDQKGNVGSSGGLAGNMTKHTCHRFLDAMLRWNVFQKGMTILDIGHENGKLVAHLSLFLNMMGIDDVNVLGIEIDSERYYASVVLLQDLLACCGQQDLAVPRIGLVNESFREVTKLDGFRAVMAFDPRFGEEIMQHIAQLIRLSDDVEFLFSSRTLRNLTALGFTNIEPLMVPIDDEPTENDENNEDETDVDEDPGTTGPLNFTTETTTKPAVCPIRMAGGGQPFRMYGYRVMRVSSSSSSSASSSSSVRSILLPSY